MCKTRRYVGSIVFKGALWLEGSSSRSNDGFEAGQPPDNYTSMKTNLDKKRTSKRKSHSKGRSDNVDADLVRMYVPPPTAEGSGRTFLILFAESQTCR